MVTPQSEAQKLAAALNLAVPLYVKREDMHPYGSHKGRSIPIMIEHYVREGWKHFCISSSGNAALAAIHAIEDYNKDHAATPVTLHILVGHRIAPDKLTILRQTVIGEQITIQQTENPKQTAFQLDKDCKAKNLRQSTDDSALVGYHELAQELALIKSLGAVFIPTSSGTTAQGLYEGFQELGVSPEIHIVQTAACHPFVQSLVTAETSLASAIVDNIGHRKQHITNIIKTTHGNGWVATDEEITKVKALVKETEGLDISVNSALSVAGLVQAVHDGWVFQGPIVCLLTGR